MTYSSKSFDQIVSRLRAEFPGVKLLALGQTIYWDEPVKAILRRLLDERYPEAVMVVGIHDADYFSKVPATVNLSEGWHILSHNDGATKDLWVATGEISRLYGSETFPSRDALVNCGVQVDKIGRDYPGGRDALVNTATEAWGWRGLAHVDSGSEVSCCVPLRDALPHFILLVEWGLSHTLDSLAGADAERGRVIADELLADIHAFAESHPDASITDIFLDFLPRFYGRLLGYQPSNLELAGATSLFRFNKSTAGLPRFNLLGAFLNPETKAACLEAYNLAVEGSDTYTLDRFPAGAIPFDLVAPGKGRGTIRLLDGEAVIDFNEPVSLPTGALPETPEDLANLIEEHFGPEAVLIGKALTMVLMMASEFIFILHEQASAYVPRCEKMAALMKERGVNLSFYPILRIDYHTWDSLDACDATFDLPSHLAAAFRQGEVTSKEFADTWSSIVREQEGLLARLAKTATLDDLLAFLAEQQRDPWPARIEAYMTAYATIREISERTEPMKAESIRLRDQGHQIKAEIQRMELEKGEHFRNSVKPLRDELASLELEGNNSEAERLRTQLDEQEQARMEIERRIEERREEANEAHNQSLALKHAVKSLEKGEEAEKAREVIKRVDYEAEFARLWLVRDAILVSQGLEYTDHRPSAWWFLLVDPELKWFNRVADTAEFRFEEIDPP